jgi:hypothetical protein
MDEQPDFDLEDHFLLDMVAKTSNKEKMKMSIPFKNYRPWAGLDDDEEAAPEGEEEKPQDSPEYKLTAIEEVLKLETMYQRKVARIVKAHIKAENEPVQFLAPTKQNADLKRNLEMKLQKTSLQTDKAIIELLKLKRDK